MKYKKKKKNKAATNKTNIKNSPTSTVTCTLIFPFSFEAEKISVEMSLPIFCELLLLTATALLAAAEIIFLSCSIWNASLSLPSGERRLNVVSYKWFGGYEVVWPYNGFCGGFVVTTEFGYRWLLLFDILLFAVLLVSGGVELFLILLFGRTTESVISDAIEFGSVVLSGTVNPLKKKKHKINS